MLGRVNAAPGVPASQEPKGNRCGCNHWTTPKCPARDCPWQGKRPVDAGVGAPVLRCKHCGVAPASVVQVGWICKDDLERLRQTGEAEIYEERQEFRLVPEQEQFAVYVRKDADGVNAPDGGQKP